MNGFPWELYNLEEDWTQATDLAANTPDKLRDMQQRFTMEAEKYRVFPLDDSVLTRFVSQDKPNYAFGRTLFTYTGEIANVPYPGIGSATSLLDRDYTITAQITIPEADAEGMLITDGGHFGGFGFYLLKGKPVFTWNLLRRDREVAGQGGAGARQAHAGVRLEIRRPGLRKGRHRHSEGRRQGRGQPRHAQRARDPAVVRDLLRRSGHRHAGG